MRFVWASLWLRLRPRARYYCIQHICFWMGYESSVVGAWDGVVTFYTLTMFNTKQLAQKLPLLIWNAIRTLDSDSLDLKGDSYFRKISAINSSLFVEFYVRSPCRWCIVCHPSSSMVSPLGHWLPIVDVPICTRKKAERARSGIGRKQIWKRERMAAIPQR